MTDPGNEVFGNIASIPSLEFSITLIAFFFFLMFMEIIVNYVDDWARQRGLLALFEKLQKELMMMGIVSFIVFCLQNFWTTVAHYRVDLETADLTSLFMAVGFVFQASVLVVYASFAGRRYLSAARLTPEALIEMYENLKAGSNAHWLFHNLPSFLPCWPSFRADIEFRIIERLFISNHNLPAEFNFANYLTTLFKVSVLWALRVR
jgi:hypothetical protein